MCQLLGMNCAAPTTDFTLSLQGLCQRGGETDIHRHGWGCAIYDAGPGGGGGLRCFHDTLPAAMSPMAQQLVQNDHRIRTHNMMAHIRYATQGPISLENVHPFTRELWGIQWTFAHNGDCPKFSNVHDSIQGLPVLGQTAVAAAALSSSSSKSNCYHPVGDTDSEAVFCAILNAIQAKFNQHPAAVGDGNDGGGGALPTLPALHEFLQELCREIVKNDNGNIDDDTIFNFLLGCGQYTLFAYSWPGSRPGSTVWNGLHYIVREPSATASSLDNDALDEGNNDSRTVATKNGANQHRVAVITTKPLTGEAGWCEMKRGELIMFDHGRPHRTAACCEMVELEGRGLCSQVLEHIPIKIGFCRSRSSSSITSSTSCSSSSSSGRNINTCNLHHDHGGPPSLSLHHQQYQEQTQVHDNDDKSSSSTINSDIENTFYICSGAAGVDATTSAMTSVKCCNDIGAPAAPPSAPEDARPVEIKAEKRKPLFGHREPCRHIA